MEDNKNGKFKSWFKKATMFNKAQIPLLILFSIVSVSCMFLFSNSKTAHYEAVANEIALTAKKSNNKQLTGDFYPILSPEEKTYSKLSKTISDTKKFNRNNYIFYRDNGHKVRVIANGEGRTDYRFPALPNNPTFILENTFSTSWGGDHVYENYDIYLLNKKSVIPSGGQKFFFINETDANYLIEHNAEFKGLTLDQIPGKSLTLEYTESGIQKSEIWQIANVVMANQLDDALYKSLYTSYIIADFHLPLLNNCYCIAFDFSFSSVDNAKFLNQVVPKYSGHQLCFDTRNFKYVSQTEINNIINDFSALKNVKKTEIRSLIISAVIIIVFAVLVYFWNKKYPLPTLSTNIYIGTTAFIIYTFFFACSRLMSSNFITRAFNTYSILIFIFLTIYSLIALYLATPNEKDVASNSMVDLSEGRNNEK